MEIALVKAFGTGINLVFECVMESCVDHSLKELQMIPGIGQEL